jgi:hypothetical protein
MKLVAIAEWRFKMLKSIRGPDEQGVDPTNHTGTECVADDKLNCLHPEIAGIGSWEGYAACLTPFVLFCTVLYTSSTEQRDTDRCDCDSKSARIWQMLPMHENEGSLFFRKDL